tara:strand:- start:3690 stop:4055 length:366 start_codon:yes stop_codon:yes gene_type:complete
MGFPSNTNTNTLMGNPYIGNSFGTANVFGGVKPPSSIYSLPTPKFKPVKTQFQKDLEFKETLKKIEKEEAERKRLEAERKRLEEESSWWSKRSKPQKISIVIGGVVTTVAIIFLIIKVAKK